MPEEQAEPEDTAIPARSKPITAVSALRPGTVNRVVLGRRGTSIGEHDDPGSPSQAGFKLASQPFETACITFQHAHGGLGRGAETRDSRDVLGPRPAPEFLTAAAQHRLKAEQAVSQDQGADALGTADLVRRKRHQIGTQGIDIERYLSKGLDRVDMQQAARLMYDLSGLTYRLNGAGFVVGEHHRDQRGRAARQQRPQAIEVEQARTADADAFDRFSGKSSA